MAAGVVETTDGAKLYLDAINAQGGVNGQKIELVQMDDKFDPKLAAENAKVLITEKNVAALFLARHADHAGHHAAARAVQGAADRAVHRRDGAVLPVTLGFNVRATYQREAERAVQHLSLIGIERIGVIHVDDSFGGDLLEGAKKGFAAVAKNPVFVEKYDRAKWDFSKIAPLVASSDVQAVLFMARATGWSTASPPSARPARARRSSPSRTTPRAASSNSLKENARGVIVTQVFPYERSLAAPIVGGARLRQARGLEGVTPAMLEGYAAARCW